MSNSMMIWRTFLRVFEPNLTQCAGLLIARIRYIDRINISADKLITDTEIISLLPDPTYNLTPRNYYPMDPIGQIHDIESLQMEPTKQ